MKITLTPDIEIALAKKAKKNGTTPERLALDTLRERFLSPSESEIAIPTNESLADFLREHIGVISSRDYFSGRSHLSEKTGKKFGASLLKKRQQKQK
jgi:hypothetical protein